MTRSLVDLDDAIELNATTISSLDIALVPLTSQTKECKSSYASLLKRKVMGDFLVKRGGHEDQLEVQILPADRGPPPLL